MKRIRRTHMKIKNILISCGLALAMGLGVGASLLSANNFKEAKADDPEITYKKYYFDYKQKLNKSPYNLMFHFYQQDYFFYYIPYFYNLMLYL